MKIKELMSLADDFINEEKSKRKEKIKCLKHVLDKLRKRETKLDLKYNEGRGNKEKISKELALIHAHRKKGIELLKQYKKEKKDAKKAKKVKEQNTTKE